MSPLISVILPVYNQERYIAETIESILSQTFQDFEMIVIDDGSSDNSVEIIKRKAENNNKIVLLVQTNTGKPQAMSNAVSKAQGELLAFIDHDDLMLPDRLEKQAAFHSSNPEVSACSCHCYYIDENGDNIGMQRFTNMKTVEECKKVMIDKDLILCAMTGFMIKKDVFLKVGGFKSKYWPCDDYEFFNRLLDEGFFLVIIQEALMKYRIHSSATTVSKPLHVDYMKGYVEDCMSRRRTGTPEINFNDFMQLKQKEPFWTKFKHRKFYYGFIFLRKASFDLHKKKYLNFLWRFVVAFVLSPKYVSAVILNKFKDE